MCETALVGLLCVKKNRCNSSPIRRASCFFFFTAIIYLLLQYKKNMGGLFSGFKKESTPEEALFEAIRSNDLKAVTELFNTNVSESERKKKLNVPPGKTMQEFLNFLVTPEFQTPLMLACKHGSLSIVEFFVKTLKCNVNYRSINNGSAALHFAAGHGHAEVCSLLLDHGADVSLLTNKGFTAIDFARMFSKIDALRMIERKTCLYTGILELEKSTKVQSGLGGFSE